MHSHSYILSLHQSISPCQVSPPLLYLYPPIWKVWWQCVLVFKLTEIMIYTCRPRVRGCTGNIGGLSWTCLTHSNHHWRCVLLILFIKLAGYNKHKQNQHICFIISRALIQLGQLSCPRSSVVRTPTYLECSVSCSNPTQGISSMTSLLIFYMQVLRLSTLWFWW